MKIWFNGKLIKKEKANTHILTHALHYGSGVFEGIRCYKTDKGPAVFRLKEHVERLFKSAQALKMKIPYSQKQIQEAILKTLKENKLQEAYIRPIVFYGSDKMGLDPKGCSVDIAIATWSWGKYLSKDSVKVKISKIIRLHPKSVISTAKICGYYVNSILATQEAKESGYDEALLLDYQGNIAEGPGENIFFIKDNILYTPEKSNILPGITRDAIIKIAKDLKIKVKEKKIKAKEIQKMQEAFFTGTAVEICPIEQIDKKKLKSNNLSIKIKEVFERTIKGQEKKYLNWLSLVK